MVLTAVFFGSCIEDVLPAYLAHQVDKILNWKDLVEFLSLISINSLDKEPELVIDCVLIPLQNALVNPEVCSLNETAKELLVEEFALFISLI
jgi:hypothetical protein